MIGLERRAAPRAVGELIRCTAPAQRRREAVILLENLGGVFRPIGRAALADPQADAKWLVAPCGRVFTSDQFAGANEGGGALELLQRQQAQRVAHQHGHAAATGIACHLALQPSDAQRVCRKTEVGFGLAAARGKPQYIGDGVERVRAIGM